jgi:hypothetical protein
VAAEALVEVFEDSDGEVRLVLNHREPENTTPGQVRISLAYDLPHLGGRHWWFVCPLCGRRRLHLYLRSHDWGCRVCHGMTYRSCQEAQRLEREFAA